jgi:uncharacterized damage-inducible protein DinB
MPRFVPSALAASLVVALATPAAAQQAAAAGAAPGSASAAVDAVESLYRPVQRFVVAAAEQIPDSLYGYRPTANVRTVGQLFAHMANFHNLGCATALGEANPSKEDYEKSRTTKAAIVEALRTSSEVCERAFAQNDAATMGTAKLFGQDRSRLSILTMVTTHDWEHYGNLVTYMRMVGLVPPSSQ